MGLLDIKFGTNLAGVIFNPAGYLAQRQSVSEAAADYLAQYPPDTSALATEIGYATYSKQYIDGCAAKLKSDDVGKTKANCVAGCRQAFEQDPDVQAAAGAARIAAAAEKATVQEQSKKLLVIIVIAIIAFILLTLILKS